MGGGQPRHRLDRVHAGRCTLGFGHTYRFRPSVQRWPARAALSVPLQRQRPAATPRCSEPAAKLIIHAAGRLPELAGSAERLPHRLDLSVKGHSLCGCSDSLPRWRHLRTGRWRNVTGAQRFRCLGESKPGRLSADGHLCQSSCGHHGLDRDAECRDPKHRNDCFPLEHGRHRRLRREQLPQHPGRRRNLHGHTHVHALRCRHTAGSAVRHRGIVSSRLRHAHRPGRRLSAHLQRLHRLWRSPGANTLGPMVQGRDRVHFLTGAIFQSQLRRDHGRGSGLWPRLPGSRQLRASRGGIVPELLPWRAVHAGSDRRSDCHADSERHNRRRKRDTGTHRNRPCADRSVAHTCQ